MKQLVRKEMIRISLIDEAKLKIFLQIKGEEEHEKLYDKAIAPFFGNYCCVKATNNTLYNLAATILHNFDSFRFCGCIQKGNLSEEERILKLMGYIDDMCCVTFYKIFRGAMK